MPPVGGVLSMGEPPNRGGEFYALPPKLGVSRVSPVIPVWGVSPKATPPGLYPQ